MKKIFYIFLFIFIFQIVTNAESWIDTKNTDGTAIYINKDSIQIIGQGIKFDVMYHAKNNGAWMTRNMYLLGEKVAILNTVKLTDYKENTDIYTSANIKFKNCSSTPINNACMIAKQTAIGRQNLTYNAENTPFNNISDEVSNNVEDNIYDADYERNEEDNAPKGEPAWGPYICDLENKINNNWKPKNKNLKGAGVTLRIGKSGNLIGQKLIASSGDHDFDASVKKAIQKTSPYRPLPPEYDGKAVEIDLIFDYNKYGKFIKQHL